MRHFILGIATAGALIGVVALSRSGIATGERIIADPNALQIESGDKNPWTSLKLNNDPEQFQFAVVADRTGGHRDKVFSRSVLQVNLLQPQFVMSVGDLIEGYTTKEETIQGEWDEFDGYVKKYEMPFFYVAGNHDLSNKVMVAKWGERYGKRYYHFLYKNALFLCINCENPPLLGTIDNEQQQWIARTLEANRGVRWTFVFLHRPLWIAKDLEKNGWAAAERALAGRKYTVFVGHEHRYQLYERNGARYYQLATTGGGSRMRGPEYGEFDQVMWVTMKKELPIFVNLDLNGILPSNLRIPESEEKGMPYKKKPTQPVNGKLSLDGKPLDAYTVTFYTLNPITEKYNPVADSLTDSSGRFQLSTYGKFDGCPTGDYIVTVAKTGKGYYDAPQPLATDLPAQYTDPKTTPLRVKVKEGTNDLNLELTK
jgi:predicted phosphodiesterase